MARIYISSTFRDLVEERRAVRDAVVRLGHLPVAMETYTATERRPLEKCLDDVAKCQAYVGIFAGRYGFVPAGQRESITRLEYDEAGRRGIPRLIFLLHDEAPWGLDRVDRDQTRIRELREHLSAEHGVGWFRDASGLEAEVTAALSRRFGACAPIPELLPYMSDCKPQEEALAEALEKLDQQPVPKPLVVLVHGDERQCHDKFLERLQKETLPSNLGLAADQAVEGVFLPWPRNCTARRQIHERLLKGLAERVLGRRTTNTDELDEAFRPGPVLVHTHLLTRDWQPSGDETLNAFLDLWQEWPDMVPGQRLLAFLFFKYELANTRDGGLLSRALRVLRRGDSVEPNDQIALAIEGFDFSAFDRVQELVLPRLADVERGDTENWARDAAPKVGMPSEVLVQATRDLYLRRQSKALPMEDLVEELRGMLHHHNSSVE